MTLLKRRDSHISSEWHLVSNVLLFAHFPLPCNSPGSPERLIKRVRLDEPHSPIRTQVAPPQTQDMFVYLPPINRPVHVLRQIHPHGFIVNDSRVKPLQHSKPFDDYMTYLATGKLDKYFNSTESAALVTDLKVTLPNRPMLLLHNLENTHTTCGLQGCLNLIHVRLFESLSRWMTYKCRLVQPSLCGLWFRKDSTLPRGTLPPMGVIYFMQRCRKAPGSWLL